MAPEVFDNQYDEKCDVWSCGVILYILICGEPPFNAEDMDELKKKIRKGDYEKSNSQWKKSSNNFKDLIEKLLTVDPKKRISAS